MAYYCSVKGRRDEEVGQAVERVYEVAEVVSTCHRQSHTRPYRRVGKDCGLLCSEKVV